MTPTRFQGYCAFWRDRLARYHWLGVVTVPACYHQSED